MTLTELSSKDYEIKPKRLFNIYGDFGTGYAGNVWDVECISPTIKCESGGENRQPLIIEVKNVD